VEPLAWRLYLLLNQQRQRHLKPLEWSAQLATSAHAHCLRMSLEGNLERRFSGEDDLALRAAQAGGQFSAVEESLAAGSTVEVIHRQRPEGADFDDTALIPAMDSVGIAISALHGVLYAVVDYAQSAPPLQPAPLEKMVEKLLHARGIAPVSDKSDARTVCRSGNIVKAAPSFVMSWENQDLSQLPSSLIEILPPPRDLAWQPNSYRVAVLFYTDGASVGVY
jgi:hypothetical protein